MHAFWQEPTLDDPAATIILLGVILGASIFVDALARRVALPRISLLVLVGMVFALLHDAFAGGTGSSPLGGLAEPLINLAMVMVAFLLGGELSFRKLKQTGAVIFLVSLLVTVVGAIIVGAGLALAGFPALVAVSLAAISVATDPAAVREVVREHRRTSGGRSFLSRVLLGVVAIDDAWGILSFVLAMALLGLLGTGGDALVVAALWEVVGALLVGALIGVPAIWLTGRLSPGEPMQVEALAMVLLLAGITSWLQVSSLLAAMFAGFLVTNFSSHHKRSFREIEHIEWPFMVFFFVLSGASVNPGHLGAGLTLLIAFVMLRLVGRYIAGALAARFAHALTGVRMPGNVGLALTPQAGVAIGMALLIAERYPESGALLVSVTVASTVLFELVGPILAARVLNSAD